jgi:hypothetical protein
MFSTAFSLHAVDYEGRKRLARIESLFDVKQQKAVKVEESHVSRRRASREV